MKLLTDQRARLVISIVGDRDDVLEAAESIIKLDKNLKSRTWPLIQPVLNDDQGRYLVVLTLNDTASDKD